MATLFLIVLVDLIGFGIIIPLLPFYAERYDASPDQVGLLMATYSLAQFLTAPFWGRLSDRVGRRPVLLFTIAGGTAAYVWMGFAESLTALFLARAVGGAMAGNIATAFAYVADVTTPDERAKGMGKIGAAFSLGFILGPAIGGLLAGADPATADFRSPVLAAAALSGTAMVLALLFLKESHPPGARRPGDDGTAPQTTLLGVLRTPAMALLIGTSFLATFVFGGLEATFALWSERRFDWGPEQNGYLFAAIGVLGALIQGGAIGRLTRRFGEARLIVQGAAALAVGIAFIPLAPSPPWLVVAMLMVMYGFSIINPSLNSLISRRVVVGNHGQAMGIGRSATTLARVFGPAWAGFLFAALGKDWPFYAGAVVMVVVIALGLRVVRATSRPWTS